MPLMELPDGIEMSYQELQMLLGERDVIIWMLQKDLAKSQRQVAELLKEKEDGGS